MNTISCEKLKCIWMASQVIEYKLCDNNFDCENCLFDKAMKNFISKAEDKFSVSQNVAESITHKITDIKRDDKIVYLKNSLIAKKICQDTFYFGLSPILECFLDASSTITINRDKQIIHCGQKIFEISGEWGSVDISSPLDLMIYDRIPNTNNNSLKPLWYAIIGDSGREINDYKSSKHEWESTYNKAISMLDDIKTREPSIGETMKDGGTATKYLHQIIGNKKYVEALQRLTS